MAYTEITLVCDASAIHMQSPDIVAGSAPYSILTKEGIEESQQLGETWASDHYNPDAAYTSPILRAMNTLQIAQTSGGLMVGSEVSPALAEQCLGYSEDKPYDQIYKPYTLQMMGNQGALYQYQGKNSLGTVGESLLNTAKRMTGFLSLAHEKLSNDKHAVVAISHQTAISGMVNYLELGGDHQPVDPFELQYNTVDGTHHAITPCSQSLIIIEDGPSPAEPKFRIEHVGRPLPS